MITIMEKAPPHASTLTSKYQATIPLAVRKTLGLKKGDKIQFEIWDGGAVFLRRDDRPIDWEWHKLIESTMTEWNSPEDEEAFKDL